MRERTGWDTEKCAAEQDVGLEDDFLAAFGFARALRFAFRAAAGGQAQRHDERQTQRKNFFVICRQFNDYRNAY